MAYAFQPGTRPVVSVAFVNATGAPTAPSAVTVSTLSPAGARVDYSSPHATITLGTTVVWTAPAQLTEAGLWTVRMVGTAGVQAADEQNFNVLATRLP